MANRRDQIKMSRVEIIDFVGEQKLATVSSNGVRGWPHSMPLWYVPRDGEVWVWTFGKSQKVKNLERDNRATVLIEAGEKYAELRGVMLETEVVLHREPEVVTEFAHELGLRYSKETGVDPGSAGDAFASQIPKRVAMQFLAVRTTSWDHRKLAGTY